MLSAVQHQQLVPEEEILVNDKNNFRNTKITNEEDEDEDFYFLSQHLNSSGLSLLQQQEQEQNIPNNFEVANRAFYATINKFTRQSTHIETSTRRRSPPYSFLENWHLHSIYSKSQQTLLGITPVRPTVLLSGDDFMFTPPFIQQEDIYEEEDEEEGECCLLNEGNQRILDWDHNGEDEYYHLSPCSSSESNLYIEEEDDYDDYDSLLYRQDNNNIAASPSNNNLILFETSTPSLKNSNHDYFNTFNDHHHQENIWIENEQHNLIHIQPNDDLLLSSSEEQQDHHVIDININDDELYTSDSSSSDEQDDDLSSYDINNLYTQQAIMTRSSSSVLSHKSEEEVDNVSVMSYQSLADIINKNTSMSSILQDVIIIEEEPTIIETTRFNSYGSTIANQVESHQSSIFDQFKEIMETAMNLVRFNHFFNNYYATHHDGNNRSSHSNNNSNSSGNIFIRPFVYILYIWQLLILCVESFIKQIGMTVTSLFSKRNDGEGEREPLL